MASTSPSLHLGFSLLLFLIFSNALVTSLSSSPATNSEKLIGGGGGTRVGGRTEIKDVKTNKEIQDLGKFSVNEFNKNHQTHITFSQVVKAESQVVSGIKYYLKINAADGGVKKVYDAVVVVKAWLHSTELVSFDLSSH